MAMHLKFCEVGAWCSIYSQGARGREEGQLLKEQDERVVAAAKQQRA
jgi:hypothetical protein